MANGLPRTNGGGGSKEPSMPRENIILECTECKDRNYVTTKNRRKHPERQEWKKFCPRCGSHKQHKETK